MKSLCVMILCHPPIAGTSVDAPDGVVEGIEGHGLLGVQTPLKAGWGARGAEAGVRAVRS